MTVAELQLLLSDLGKFLRASDSAKAASELEYLSEKLLAFKGYKLRAFADFLEKAEAESRATPPKKKGAGPSKGGAEAVNRACQQLLHLYNRAIDPSTTLEAIESAVKTLQDLDPPKATLEALAKQVGSSLKFKTKAEAIKEIRRQIIGRKGAFDRPNA